MSSRYSIKKIDAEQVGLPVLVYHALREAILNGVYQAGDVLRQEELAKGLGVSRAPLREALPRLVAEGLVVNHPRRGYAVASLNLEDVTEIFELRALVEESAIRIAVGRRTTESVTELRAISEQMRVVAEEMGVGRPIRWETVADWANLNAQFHDCLLSLSGRKRFMRVADQLRREAGAYIRAEIRLTGDVAQAQSEHELIVEAFAVGDADHVACLSREHCEHTASRLLSGLKSRNSDSEKHILAAR